MQDSVPYSFAVDGASYPKVLPLRLFWQNIGVFRNKATEDIGRIAAVGPITIFPSLAIIVSFSRK
ncbi:MAG: hypothetical protein R3B47_13150 [Bacteroidia bacterium]